MQAHRLNDMQAFGRLREGGVENERVQAAQGQQRLERHLWRQIALQQRQNLQVRQLAAQLAHDSAKGAGLLGGAEDGADVEGQRAQEAVRLHAEASEG